MVFYFPTRSELPNYREHSQVFTAITMLLRVSHLCDSYITVFYIYVPNFNSSEETIMAFYQDFRIAVTKVPKIDSSLPYCYLNTRISKDHKTWMVSGKNGI